MRSDELAYDRVEANGLSRVSVNCWPTPRGDGTYDVNIEYELEATHMTLHNVTLTIPLP